MFCRRTLLAGAVFALVACACSRPELPVKVIEGATSVYPPIPRATVIIKGDRIAAIGPEKTTAIPAACEHFNGVGRWIVAENRGETLRAGASANLLLLSADPREHPANYHRVVRAMHGGHWLQGPTH